MRAGTVSVLDLVSSSRSLRPQLSVRRFLLLFRFLWIALVIYRKYSLSPDCTSWSSICMRPCVFLDFFWGSVTGFHARNDEFGDLGVKFAGNPWFCSSSINFLNVVMGETGWFMVKVAMSALNFFSSSEMLTLLSSFVSVEKVRKRGIGKILGRKTLAFGSMTTSRINIVEYS
ncbi:hypothetical protein BHE74_00015831 [Ensete ventricosum]|nr:hypothetical protein BHE74_00015831 [Ensete ventricosum]RZR95194.1 hypothetical protein BHM03_00023999 [Ensete ventricosum]